MPCWSRCFFSSTTLFWVVVGGLVVGFVAAFGLCVIIGGIGSLGGPLAGATVGLSCTVAEASIGYIFVFGGIGFLIGAVVTALGQGFLCAVWCSGSSAPAAAIPQQTATVTGGLAGRGLTCPDAQAGLRDAEAALAAARAARDRQKAVVDGWDARTGTARAAAAAAAAVLAATALWNVVALAAATAALALAGAVLAGLTVASAADRAALLALEGQVTAREGALDVWRKLVASLCPPVQKTPTVDTGQGVPGGVRTMPNP